MSAKKLIKKPSTNLQVAGFTLARTGLVVDGEPTLHAWKKVGQAIEHASGAVQWWIGDWLNMGQHHYGDAYEAEIEAVWNAKWLHVGCEKN